MQVLSPSISVRGSLRSFHQTWVMGILNLTPDSFHDGGAWNDTGRAVAQAERMLREGADVLDLGAQSTRPGAEQVGADEEWTRLSPVLIALRNAHPDALLSIDTFHASVARRALDAGADLINDVSGGDADPEMWKVVADARAPYVMMHMQGTPETMQAKPTYNDVVSDVYQKPPNQALPRLRRRRHRCDCGRGLWVWQDGGAQLRPAGRPAGIACAAMPVLVGVSRKVHDPESPRCSSDDALNGSTTLHAWAVDRGAHPARPRRGGSRGGGQPCTRHCENPELRRTHDLDSLHLNCGNAIAPLSRWACRRSTWCSWP